MKHPYKTREGGATVTIFVPYDCKNHCPFCINKEEYGDMTGFSLEKIVESIRRMDAITPRCDFVFTGGEPFADIDMIGYLILTLVASVLLRLLERIMDGSDSYELAQGDQLVMAAGTYSHPDRGTPFDEVNKEYEGEEQRERIRIGLKNRNGSTRGGR